MDLEISRRRALGLGIGLAAASGLAAVLPGRLGRLDLAAAGATEHCAGGEGSTNSVVNGSFQDGPPGPTAPGWTFVLPSPPP